MPQALKPRQQQILDCIVQHLSQFGYPPTVREIGQKVGLSSSSTVQNYLDQLERIGCIRRDPTKSRTVEVVGAQAMPARMSVISLPLIGRVAAGTPILATENIEDTIVVGPEIARGEDLYALTVHGDSMEPGIRDGDIVVVKPGSEAANGAVVVARIENDITGEPEVTVKRFYREKTGIRLQPENPNYEPIRTTNVAIEGSVIAVIRLLA